ncbi:hypothetical protein EWB00_000717 [Schistosoma japonicum]|uniref:Uncharacterized protein n=1 Tax=Schistosoma japonicum TaxID=6182 RepID=A0A4Z2CK54_SCHJA|nr:hypothetical protein EWB00_000717 [Schistosoma japonicum]
MAATCSHPRHPILHPEILTSPSAVNQWMESSNDEDVNASYLPTEPVGCKDALTGSGFEEAATAPAPPCG